MVMTPCTADGQTEKRCARCDHDVVKVIVFSCQSAVRFIIPDVEAVVTRRDESNIAAIWQLIPSQLLHHEAVIGLVLVDALDDPVPVAPSIWFW